MKPVVTKLIFLDLDGVVNSTTSAGSHEKFGEENVAALNRILAQTDAKIVVASTWRFGWSDQQLCRILRENGIRGEMVGVTSRDEKDGNGAIGWRNRGLLIQEWLDWFRKGNIHEDGLRLPHPEKIVFVILDDNKNLEPFANRHIRTDPTVGLTDADADRAILMLKEVTW